MLFVYRMMDDDSSLMMVTQLMMAPERTPGIIMGTVILRKVVMSEAPGNGRFFDAGTDISQNGAGGTDGIGHSPHGEGNNHDERRSGKDNRRFIERKDESDTEDGAGMMKGNIVMTSRMLFSVFLFRTER